MARISYEADAGHFAADAYVDKGWRGIAWHVLGWGTEPDESFSWSGVVVRTGRVVAIMVGDDRRFTFDEGDLQPLQRAEYCGECGQICCSHDGLDRSEVT